MVQKRCFRALHQTSGASVNVQIVPFPSRTLVRRPSHVVVLLVGVSWLMVRRSPVFKILGVDKGVPYSPY